MQFVSEREVDAAIAHADLQHAQTMVLVNKSLQSRQQHLHRKELFAGFCHFHRTEVFNSVFSLLDGIFFDVIVFPCCGFAVTESLLVKALSRSRNKPIRSIFMDQCIECCVLYEAESDDFVHSFEQLAYTLKSLTTRAVVVGVNALISNPYMQQDPFYEAFLAVCEQSTWVYPNAILAWNDGIHEQHHASMPWKFMHTFCPYTLSQ
jgi:hypothetical protein